MKKQKREKIYYQQYIFKAFDYIPIYFLYSNSWFVVHLSLES